MLKIEILAPGGGFNSSLHAFEAGADAVYTGLSSFSARKGAKNFSLEQLRRLKTYAVKNEKKIFVAMNTVLKESELPEVIQTLHHLSLLEIDAIILQDPGLAYIIKNYFPRLEIHASTQMAVHNAQGVDYLKKAGFSRIILARELTLKEIKRIRDLHRDVELEVFIHGAMCCSFSGICLASGMLLGRSGNRGSCGQICRTWFESSNGNKYQFSANDLKAGKLVKQLEEIGIDSLKIEGRLKSPEYVSHTVAYYRSIIDGRTDNIIDEEETLSSVSFSRDQTSAFLKNPKGENMINNTYASHTGIRAGIVISSGKKDFTIKSEVRLSDRDGLLIMDGQGPRQFAMNSEGQKTHYAPGEMIKIHHSGVVETGTIIQKISGHDLQLKEFNENSWKPWKTPLSISAVLNRSSIVLKAVLFEESLMISHDIIIEESNSGKSILEILSQNLAKSGSSIFTVESVELENRTDLEENQIFIPLSLLKKVKSRFYQALEERVENIVLKKSDLILASVMDHLNSLKNRIQTEIAIPQRREMIPGSSSIPFVVDSVQEENHNVFFPLPPLLFHDLDFIKMEGKIESISSDPEKKLIIGLNNISHFYFVEKYQKEKNIFFFTDYCTYIANSAAQLFYSEGIEKLLFSYYWIEDHMGKLNNLKVIEKEFRPHLFVSRICYKKHNKLGSCEHCSKELKYELQQRNNSFVVEVKDCISWLFQKG